MQEIKSLMRAWERARQGNDLTGAQQIEGQIENMFPRNEQLKKRISFLFEEKIKTVESNLANLKGHRNRAYATGHRTEDYDRELARMQEKHNTLTTLYQEIQGIIAETCVCEGIE